MKGLKKINKITLFDIFLLEKGDMSGLKRPLNFLPLFLFKKELDKLMVEILETANNDNFGDLELEVMEYEIEQTLEINELIGIDNLLTSTLINRSKILILKERVTNAIGFKKRRLRKITDKPNLFSFCSNRVNKILGYELKTLDDVVRFRRDLKRKTDRYSDYWKRKNEDKQQNEHEDKKRSIISVAYSYLNFLDMSIDVDTLRFFNYIEIRNLANEKMKEIKRQKLKHEAES